MLLIPLDRKLDWRQPPLATLALGLVTVLVFVLLQPGDGPRHRDAMTYYQESGLKALEFARYREELADREPDHWLAATAIEDIPPATAFWTITQDADFAGRLARGEVITPDDAAYLDWRADRLGLESRLDTVTFWRFGLRPGDLRPEALLTHVFLHGDVLHLLGNMLFLVALGMLVEAAIGCQRMLALYLLGGVLVGAADLVLTPERMIPGVGASGAIAVLMGLYAVLFGLQRVRFFYFVGVYFNYTRAPALVLLPLWLGWELLNGFWLSADSNVHYGAHSIGLVLGAVAGVGLRLFWPAAINREFLLAGDRQEQQQREAERIEERLRELDYAGALPLLERQLEREPGNLTVLHRIHRCLRLSPDSRRYHAVSHQLLAWQAGHRDDEEVVLEVYRDYRRRARPRPRLTGRLLQSLALRFARIDARAEAEELGGNAVRRRLPEAPAILVPLAEMHLRAGHPERAQPCLEQLTASFDGSQEAEYGRGLLRRIHGRRRPGTAGADG